MAISLTAPLSDNYGPTPLALLPTLLTDDDIPPELTTLTIRKIAFLDFLTSQSPSRDTEGQD